MYVEKIEAHIYVFIKTLIKNHKNFSSKMEPLFSFPVLLALKSKSNVRRVKSSYKFAYSYSLKLELLIIKILY